MRLSDRIYYYMPDDKAVDQTNRGKFNCAEAMLKAIDDMYCLNISEDAKTQMAAFGGGFAVGDVCGLLVGGYAALSHMYNNDCNPKGTMNLRNICKEWYKRFKSESGDVNCNVIKPETGGCSGLAKSSADIFEKLIEDIGY